MCRRSKRPMMQSVVTYGVNAESANRSYSAHVAACWSYPRRLGEPCATARDGKTKPLEGARAAEPLRRECAPECPKRREDRQSTPGLAVRQPADQACQAWAVVSAGSAKTRRTIFGMGPCRGASRDDPGRPRGDAERPVPNDQPVKRSRRHGPCHHAAPSDTHSPHLTAARTPTRTAS